jgi:regulator of replication initiation timing
MEEIKLKQCPVIFDEESHTYMYKGLPLSGITSVIKHQLFGDKYSGVDADVLAKARERGDIVHSTIQVNDNLGFDDGSEMYATYQKLLKSKDLRRLQNEYLVSDLEYYASSIDLVTEDLSLVDFKTTATLDKEYLSWQLSIYKYLFEFQNPTLKVNKLYAIWLPKKGKAKIVEIKAKPIEDVLALLEADKDGKQYKPVKESESESLITAKVVDEIVKIETQAKQLKEKSETLKAGLAQIMEENGVVKWEDNRGLIRLSYTPQHEADRFQQKEFQTDYPDLYKKYVKSSTVKDSLKITLR